MEKIKNESITRPSLAADSTAEEALAGELRLARHADAALRSSQSLAVADLYVGQKSKADDLWVRGREIVAAGLRETAAHREKSAQAYQQGIREQEDAFKPLHWQAIAEMTPDELADMLKRESLALGVLKARMSHRFEHLDTVGRDADLANRREWNQLSNQVSHHREVFELKVEALREALSQSEEITRRQMLFWEKVIDKALSVRERLDDIARNAQDRHLAAADAELKRELAEKGQALDEFLARAKVRIEESRATAQEQRVGIKERHEQRLQMRQRDDLAALEELEAYVKHKLTGRGRFYKFTREPK